MSAQEIWYRNFDISLAALASRFFMIETHTWEECYDIVVKPTEEALLRLAAARPVKLVGLHSLSLADKLNLPRDWVKIFLVLPRNKIVYLGSAASLGAEYAPATICRDRYGIAIPSADTILTPSSCIDGARKYLQQVCPSLTGLPIEWLPDDISSEICEEIEYEALARSRDQPDSEIDRILEEDEPT